MGDDQSQWQRYERLIARLMADQLSTDLCVTPNARVMGKISGKRRQIDALIDARHDTDNSRRIIVDAKMRRRKVDVVQVEAFRGLMEDVGATHGYLVCPTGHTEAAQKRAQESVRTCLVPLEHLEGFDPSSWPKCQRDGCARGRVFWDGYPGLSLGLVSLEHPHQRERLEFVHSVGKCDECGRFHIKCFTCGELFSLNDDDGEHQCACRLPWFWLASIETDDQGRLSAELHAVLGTGETVTADRRSM
jgi:hypothetical protein